jgi:glutathione synthase/RimK-type ligase-like ATP-grasp enzyme
MRRFEKAKHYLRLARTRNREGCVSIARQMWNDVLELSARAASAFPYFRLLGLDIAIGADGPVIIEVECEPSPEHQITFGRGVKSLLGDLVRRGPVVWRES